MIWTGDSIAAIAPAPDTSDVYFTDPVLGAVLHIDPEVSSADTIADGLRRLSMAVDVCYDGQSALDLVSTHRYDVAVLDRWDQPVIG